MDFEPDDLAIAMSMISLCRFSPSDDQLILNYLTPKLMGLPMPFNRIQTAAIDKWTNPRELADKIPLGKDVERYFFARRGPLVADKRPNDATGERGYWEPASEDVEEIVFKDVKVGEKRELIYYQADGSKTQWVMHEYKAFLNIEFPSSSAQRKNVEDWVVYKLRNKGDVDVNDKGVAAAAAAAAAAAEAEKPVPVVAKRRKLNIAVEGVKDESDDDGDDDDEKAAGTAAAAALFVLDKASEDDDDDDDDDDDNDDDEDEEWMGKWEEHPEPKRRKGNSAEIVVVKDDSDGDDEMKEN